MLVLLCQKVKLLLLLMCVKVLCALRSSLLTMRMLLIQMLAPCVSRLKVVAKTHAAHRLLLTMIVQQSLQARIAAMVQQSVRVRTAILRVQAPFRVRDM
jgi:hypothetical protein